MALEVCLIDDSIPTTGNLDVSDTTGINSSLLELLLQKNIWPEPEVKDLVSQLCSDLTTWTVSGYKHPNFYLGTSQKLNYKPDIIIFDWDYSGFTGDISQILLKVLENSFSLVYVYTQEDKDEEVTRELDRDIFDDFKDIRLFILRKWQEVSTQTLLADIKRLTDGNFSFRFGKMLRHSTSNALEEILIGLGKNSIDFVHTLIAEEATHETDVKAMLVQRMGNCLSENKDLLKLLTSNGIDETKAKTLLELIKGKLENELSSIEVKCEKPTGSLADDTRFSKRFWANRLYYKPSDFVVRKADIVKNEKNEYFLVITPDCWLRHFWEKNFGFVNMIRAFSLTDDLCIIKNLLSQTKNTAKVEKVFIEYSQTSITNAMNSLTEGPTVLPFLDVNGQDQYLLLFPKDISSLHIMPPAIKDPDPGIRRNFCLTYNEWKQYKRQATISEPFASAIVEHCLRSLSGYGAPDYPQTIKNQIKITMTSTISGQSIPKTT